MGVRWKFKDDGDSFTVERQETTVVRHPNGFDARRRTTTVTAKTPARQIKEK